MTCKHCCGADQLFDEKQALKDLKKYNKNGPRRPTRKMTEAIERVGIKGFTLLDIGGGVGPIHLELIPKGIEKITDVDASEGYLKIAKEEAEKRGYADKISYLKGDFVDYAENLKNHDIVTLDKVICCYPNMEELVSQSLNKVNHYYALVYPMSNGLAKFGRAILNLYLRLKKNYFRTYIHNPTEVYQIITSKGFERVVNEKSFPWRVEVYRKIAATS